MKLTGKAKEDFGLWHFETTDSIFEYKNWHLLSERSKNALIIEWFDSVGIYISISADKDIYELNDVIYFISFVGDEASSQYENRQQATEQAIKYANKIYNER